MTDAEEMQKLRGQVELLKDLLEKEINKNKNCCNRCNQTYYPYQWRPISVTYQNPIQYGGSSQSTDQFAYSGGGGCKTYNNTIRRE